MVTGEAWCYGDWWGLMLWWLVRLWCCGETLILCWDIDAMVRRCDAMLWWGIVIRLGVVMIRWGIIKIEYYYWLVSATAAFTRVAEPVVFRPCWCCSYATSLASVPADATRVAEPVALRPCCCCSCAKSLAGVPADATRVAEPVVLRPCCCCCSYVTSLAKAASLMCYAITRIIA